MCSIPGVYDRQDSRFLENARAEMAGRGPVFGEIHDKDYSSVSHRLGIVGSRAYDMLYRHDDYTVTFNGEIYNYRELAARYNLSSQAYESDTHTLAEGYAKFGRTFFRYLEGMYAFAIHDQTTGGLMLGRDQFGTKPLYYGSKDDSFYFASEMKAFKNTDLDIAGQLGPGELLTLSRNSLAKSSINYTSQLKRSFVDMFHDSVKKHIPQEKFALLLSGGLDSVLLAYFLKEHDADFIAYSARSRDFSADADDAREVTEQLGIEHHVIEFNPSLIDAGKLAYRMETGNERILYGAAILDQLAARIASDGLRIVMDGNGADEMFMGYRELESQPRAAYEEYLRKVFPNAQAQRADRIAGTYQLEGRHPYLFQPFIDWVKSKDLEDIIGKKPLLKLLGEISLDIKDKLLATGKNYQLVSGTTGKSSHEAYFTEEQSQEIIATFYNSGYDRFVEPDSGEGRFFEKYPIKKTTG